MGTDQSKVIYLCVKLVGMSCLLAAGSLQVVFRLTGKGWIYIVYTDQVIDNLR